MRLVTISVLVPYEVAVPLFAQMPGVTPIVYTPDPAAPLPDGAQDAEIFIPPLLTGPVWRDVLHSLPKLRMVHTLTAGYESFVGDQVPEGVILCNARGAHGGSTAEWALGALLTIYREFLQFEDSRRAVSWDYRGTDTLQDKKVLVVGAGDLGQQMERRLLACDAVPTLVGRTARDGVRGQDELPALLPEADAVVIMVPLSEETRHLVDAKFLAAMPDGAILVNAGRGPIVHTDALVAELSTKRLRAALDVTDPEPLPTGHPLWSVPNLLLTPHVGGSVSGGAERAFRVIARSIEQLLAGKKPENQVS
ncbi:phosphoglycerate dehydrogenase [Pseudonocardiaceae bacterium YIM PH 21723]|nr:phosphoglycerate dehydrogenase [Pseudonocardiaceae bacterium YIM PH 21723]